MDDGLRFEDNTSALLRDQELPYFVEDLSSNGRIQLGERTRLLEQLLCPQGACRIADGIQRSALNGDRCGRQRRGRRHIFVGLMRHSGSIRIPSDSTYGGRPETSMVFGHLGDFSCPGSTGAPNLRTCDRRDAGHARWPRSETGAANLPETGMADLSWPEKRKFEQLFEMGGGYVLDFSNRTFGEFFMDTVGREIFDATY